MHGAKKALVVDASIKFRKGKANKLGWIMPSEDHLKIAGGKQEIKFEYAYNPATGQKYLLSS